MKPNCLLPGFNFQAAALLLVMWLVLLTGCATETGTRKDMARGALSSVQNIQVQVQVDKDFSVVLASQKVNGIDFLLLAPAMTGGLVEQVGIRVAANANLNAKSRKDATLAKNLREFISAINPASDAETALAEGLRAAPQFKSVTSEGAVAGASVDTGTLRVQITDWGLFSDKGDDRKLQKVQVGLNATASLLGGDGKVLWKRSDYMTGGIQRSFDEYRNSPDLLATEIPAVVRRYCAKIVSEIRYAK